MTRSAKRLRNWNYAAAAVAVALSLYFAVGTIALDASANWKIFGGVVALGFASLAVFKIRAAKRVGRTG